MKKTGNIFGNGFGVRENTANAVFQGGNTAGDGTVEYMRYRRTNEDLYLSKDVSIATGYTLNGDVIVGDTLHSNFVYSDSFRCRNYNVDTPFLGANVAEDGRITFMIHRLLILYYSILSTHIIESN